MNKCGLLFADDFVRMRDPPEDMQRQIDVRIRFARRR